MANFVTPEQVKKAKSVDLLEYIQRTEPGNLQKVNGSKTEYRLKSNDSLKISNGKFHWFSRNVGGANVVDYLMKVHGLKFTDAVQAVAGHLPTREASGQKRAESNLYSGGEQVKPPHIPPNAENNFFSGGEQVKTIHLPPKAESNQKMIEYLKNRGIDPNLIQYCIDQNLIYQSRQNTCVFVGFDYSSKNAKYAGERGISNDVKKDVSGSDKRYAFRINVQAPHKLYVFESAIDLLSYITLEERENREIDGQCLALGGVMSSALHMYLERNPGIKEIVLCFDNDTTGEKATERINNELKAKYGEKYKELRVFATKPVGAKDFNELLINEIKAEKIKNKEKRIR